MAGTSLASRPRSRDGRYQGEAVGGVHRFAGIRYAKPPLGPLRFQPPQPLDPRDIDSDAPGAGGAVVPPQNLSRLRGVMGDFAAGQSEDCLRLTVWAPAGDGGDAAARPVLLWLHGGAFLTGGAALDWYDGARLCEEGGVVVVGVGYRLGALGFLQHPGLSPGNLGLRDAQAALAWVRAGIGAFGGDPARITVVGQSAGAWLAALLVALAPPQPVAPVQGLILQSAPLGAMPATPQEAAFAAEDFLDALARRTGSRDAAAAARSAAPNVLLAAQDGAVGAMASRAAAGGHPPVPFGLVADGVALPLLEAYPRLLADAAARVPVLVGWTRDEMQAFRIPSVAGGSPPEVRRAGASLFAEPSLAWAQRAAHAGLPAFVYRFDWTAAPGNPIGACHCVELPFVFDSFEAFSQAPMLAGADLGAARALGRRVRAAWLAFATHGSPDAAGRDGLPPWPHFDAAHRTVMHIDGHSAAVPHGAGAAKTDRLLNLETSA